MTAPQMVGRWAEPEEGGRTQNACERVLVRDRQRSVSGVDSLASSGGLSTINWYILRWPVALSSFFCMLRTHHGVSVYGRIIRVPIENVERGRPGGIKRMGGGGKEGETAFGVR